MSEENGKEPYAWNVDNTEVPKSQPQWTDASDCINAIVLE